jgi:hypothetical protein
MKSKGDDAIAAYPFYALLLLVAIPRSECPPLLGPIDTALWRRHVLRQGKPENSP